LLEVILEVFYAISHWALTLWLSHVDKPLMTFSYQLSRNRWRCMHFHTVRPIDGTKVQAGTEEALNGKKFSVVTRSSSGNNEEPNFRHERRKIFSQRTGAPDKHFRFADPHIGCEVERNLLTANHGRKLSLLFVSLLGANETLQSVNHRN
jgi:hypothetical protein